MASQTEIGHKSEIADRDDQNARIQAERRVLEERLSNAQLEVSVVW